MGILWPDTVGNDKFLHVNVNETSVLEPLLQLGARTDFVTGPLKCSVDFVTVSFEPGTLVTAIYRVGVAVPIVELNPAAGLDGTVIC